MANITSVRLRELENAERQLQQMRDTASIQWLGDALGHNLAIMAASTPYVQWSRAQRAALHAAAGNATSALGLFVSLLPQEPRQ